jgi:hypothetical protein
MTTCYVLPKNCFDVPTVSGGNRSSIISREIGAGTIINLAAHKMGISSAVIGNRMLNYSPGMDPPRTKLEGPPMAARPFLYTKHR